MRNRSRNIKRDCVALFMAVTMLAACALASGCSTLHAPAGILPEPENLPRNVYGGWIFVEMKKSNRVQSVEGEFIALDSNSVIVMALSDVRTFVPHRIARSDINYAIIEIHTTASARYAWWTAAGTLSTLSHGWLLAISAPVWLISGSVMTAEVRNGGSFSEYDPTDRWWLSMTKHARFPQGMPRGVTIDKLKGMW